MFILNLWVYSEEQDGGLKVSYHECCTYSLQHLKITTKTSQEEKGFTVFTLSNNSGFIYTIK